MTSTESERTFIRALFGTDTSTMTDTYIDLIFDEAEEEYAAYGRSVIKYAAIVQHYDTLITQAAAVEVDYESGDSSEKRSQVIKTLESARDKYQKKIDRGIKNGAVAARWVPLAENITNRDKPGNS